MTSQRANYRKLLAWIVETKYSFCNSLKFCLSFSLSLFAQIYIILSGSYNTGKAPREFQSAKRGLQASYSSNLQLHNRHH